MFYFSMNGMSMYDERVQVIIKAVRAGFDSMEVGKPYTLKKMVELVYPGWWSMNFRRHYDSRSAGVTFKKLVENGMFPGLALRDKNEHPRKYIRIY